MTSTLLHRAAIALGAALVLVTATPALAQSETELPDDIFGEDDIASPEPSISQERDQLLAEADQPEVMLPEPDKKRIIQTLQRKTFMKIGRYEVGLGAGFVTNDPFINRYLLVPSFTYHVTEIFGIEIQGAFSPDFGELDYKPITTQIINENSVTPDISKIQFYGNLNFQYSPIYGKVAVGSNRIIVFDLFGVFGTGVVNTVDDLAALQKEGEITAIATEVQYHPTLNFGGGARVIFSEAFAIRVEGRGLSYIEVLESTTLEMKNNFTLVAMASLFFPGME